VSTESTSRERIGGRAALQFRFPGSARGWQPRNGAFQLRFEHVAVLRCDDEVPEPAAATAHYEYPMRGTQCVVPFLGPVRLSLGHVLDVGQFDAAKAKAEKSHF